VSSLVSPSIRWWHGWGPLLVVPPMFLLLVPPARGNGWVVMWGLAFSIYCGCKWLTWRRTRVEHGSWSRSLGYLVAWPGLDAEAFLDGHARVRKPTPRQWALALGKLMVGVTLLLATRHVPVDWPTVAGWVGMTGIVMLLHFGLFDLLSCGWRMRGVDARPLMNRPLAATSVSAFWGQRWNTAFRDLTHRFCFRPLAARMGPRWALVVGFVFSGLVHDVVISVPARGGYGGPTLFFVLQGIALFAERSRTGRAWGLGRGTRGWLFTAVTLLLPVPLLFHGPFVHEVVIPFLVFLGVADDSATA